MFDEAQSYEIQLPSEEECAKIVGRLEIAHMGRFFSPVLYEDNMSTIALRASSMLESDENQKVNLYAGSNL